jgi:hypothetical protein
MTSADIQAIQGSVGVSQMSNDANKARWHDILALGKILPVVLGAILAIGASYFTTKFQMSSQLHLQKVEEQRRVFARLMGRKFTTEQLYVSRYEARIFSDYHEERWKRAGAPKDSLDLQESKRWMHRSEDLVLEIVKNNQALFEDLATVRALFPDTPRLRELCDHVYAIHSLWTGEPPHDGSIEKLDQWKVEADRQLQEVAVREYGKPIDELVAFLLQQLPSD